MELELGLKTTQTRDDHSRTTNFRMAKGSSAPIFMSTETDSKFILTAHIKGFEKEHIGIKINEDGTQIMIRMERPVREIVLSGWMGHNKGAEMTGFIRAFRIPSGVDLDRIMAKFNVQDSVLTITMPKSANGEIGGAGIEEVKQVELLGSSSLIGDDIISNDSELVFESSKANHDRSSTPAESGQTKGRDALYDIDATSGSHDDKNLDTGEAAHGENDSYREGNESEMDIDEDEMDSEKEEMTKKKIELCGTCVIAGSSVIVTLVVLAIYWLRSKKRQPL